MAFQLIFKALFISLLFKLHPKVVALVVDTHLSEALHVPENIHYPDRHPMIVYDATEEQIKSINDAPTIYLSNTPIGSWAEAHQTVMKGQGAEIQRDPEQQKIWHEFLATARNKIALEWRFAEKLNWDKPAPSDVPLLLDESYVEDVNWVQFKKPDFPIAVPEGVEQQIMWIRAPMVTRESFKAKEGETLPDESWIKDHTVDELIEFINAYDSFGSNIKEKTYDPNLIVGEGLWKPSRFLLHGYQGNVKLEDGVKAMLWAGRHITRMIAKRYPDREFAWFRVNRSLRNFHVPNEIHILLQTSK